MRKLILLFAIVCVTVEAQVQPFPEPMPLVRTGTGARYAPPVPKRDEGVRKYLQAAVKIKVSWASGSGTIFWYDRRNNDAYVISCGHLFRGNKTAEQLKQSPVTANVEAFYHNEVKLQESKTYEATVICWNNDEDISFMKFKPDWKPKHYPIAPVNYPVTPGKQFESTGCDHGSEVAAYTVTIVGIQGRNLVTVKNSPRPGRSGGGMLSPDGYFIAICWGTSAYSGEGQGFFVPLERIHRYANSQNLDWMLKLPRWSLVNRIPIRNLDTGMSNFPDDFVPVPW